MSEPNKPTVAAEAATPPPAPTASVSLVCERQQFICITKGEPISVTPERAKQLRHFKRLK